MAPGFGSRGETISLSFWKNEENENDDIGWILEEISRSGDVLNLLLDKVPSLKCTYSFNFNRALP